MNTAPCKSKISYIDGDKGILRYRGYPIEELAERSTYLEVSHAPTKQRTQPPILLPLLLRSPTKNRHRSPPIPLTHTSSLNTVRVRARLRRPPRRAPAPRVGRDRHAPLRAPSPGHRRHRSSAPRRAPDGRYPRGSQRPLHFSPRAEPGVAGRVHLRQPRRPGQADRAYHREDDHARGARVPPQHGADTGASRADDGIRRKLFVHAGRRARPEPQAEPAARQGTRRHVPPPRGARDELLHRRGQAPRVQRRRRLLRRRRRRRRALRSPARRRQRGGAQDARAHREQRSDPRVPPARQGQEGEDVRVWAQGLQKL